MQVKGFLFQFWPPHAVFPHHAEDHSSVLKADHETLCLVNLNLFKCFKFLLGLSNPYLKAKSEKQNYIPKEKGSSILKQYRFGH